MTPHTLIILPQGLTISGVTTWALRLAKGLNARGFPATILAHRAPQGLATIEPPEGLRITHTDLDPLGIGNDDPDACVELYRHAIRDASRQGPAIVLPHLSGECYGSVFAAARTLADHPRVIGWQHSDIAYDRAVLRHFEPALHRFVAVSTHIAETLADALPAERRDDLRRIHYGVEPAHSTPAPPIALPLRLLYAGRLEHHQKRVMALPELSRALSRRGINHTLTIAGDGPARDELADAATHIPAIRLAGPLAPHAVAHALAEADAMVLPSRFEGLSIALLEAMAAGCIPVAARTRSGIDEAVTHGQSGIIVECTPDDDEQHVATAMADAIARHLRDPAARQAMSAAARERAARHFSLTNHIAAVAAMLVEVAAEPPRPWPADRSTRFADHAIVPHDGPQRLGALLARLANRRIVVHGTGAHTARLEGIFRTHASIAAFADDDRSRWGRELFGIPILSPADATKLNATDVVLSSWMHESDLWQRRDIYERAGLTVHRLYA